MPEDNNNQHTVQLNSKTNIKKDFEKSTKTSENITEECKEYEVTDSKSKNSEVEVEKIKVYHILLEKGLPILEKYLENQQKIEKPKFKWGMIIFIGIIALVIVPTAILVFNDRVDGSNFTFLLGTLIGATLTLFSKLLIPNE
ncbi:MAG: hypothetical protein HF967_05845 [Methanosarcinales archaeon]|nr:hypothetical protein [Methanosarcinales archaeon]